VGPLTGGTVGPAAGDSSPLRVRVRPAEGEPAGALVLLHGRGADEHDLFGLLDLLDPERRLHGVTPGGPLSLPPGGRHWYRLAGIPTPDGPTFHASVPLLDALLENLPVPHERVVLGGFSQGAVMSWALTLGPHRPRPAAVVALSGFLPRLATWPLDATRLAGVPVAIAHGALDPLIPADYGREARDVLDAAGADVVWLETPVPHTVDPDWIPALRAVVADAV
jgi:phospholipase/carboxylesterase